MLDFLSIFQTYYQQISTKLDISTLNLIVYTTGLVAYTIFIWYFYRFIARREIFPLQLQKYIPTGRKVLNILAYILEYLIIFPILVFFWFSVFSFFMILLAKDLEVETILMTTMALVTTIRITSYYKEDISIEISKLIPFAFLAIFLINPSFFSIKIVSERFLEVYSFGLYIFRFAIFTITVEWTLRLLYLIKRILIDK